MNPSGRAHVHLLSMATDITAMAAWQESGSPLKWCLKATQVGVSCGAFTMDLCSEYADNIGGKWNCAILGAPQVENHYSLRLNTHTY